MSIRWARDTAELTRRLLAKRTIGVSLAKRRSLYCWTSRLLKFTLSQVLHPILLGALILPKVNTATLQGFLQNAMMLWYKRTAVMRATEIDLQTTQTSIIQKPYR
jgi:hypothetical protein